jgi:hypothetical protein
MAQVVRDNSGGGIQINLNGVIGDRRGIAREVAGLLEEHSRQGGRVRTLAGVS